MLEAEALVNFDGWSELVKQNYYTGRTEEQLHEMEGRFRRMPLPANRGEFEVRSALMQLLFELKVYLGIAKRLKRPQSVRGSADSGSGNPNF